MNKSEIKYREINDKAIKSYESGITKSDYYKNRSGILNQFVLKIYFTRTQQIQISRYVYSLMNSELIQILNSQTRTNESDMHITFMQIIIEKEESNFDFKKYNKIFKNLFSTMGVFNIKLKGICFSSDTVMVKGFPSINLNKYREELRGKVRSNFLKLKEIYEIETAHISIYRLKSQNPKDLKLLLESAKDLKIVESENYIILKINKITAESSNYTDGKNIKTKLCKYSLVD